MRVFRAIVQVLAGPVFDVRQKRTLVFTVGQASRQDLKLELGFRNVGKPLPLRGLVFGNTQLGKRLGPVVPVYRSSVLIAGSAFRLLDLLQQLTGVVLSTQADFARAQFGFGVFSGIQCAAVADGE
jgi:hypothetical protein